jgi:hypothetical protein
MGLRKPAFALCLAALAVLPARAQQTAYAIAGGPSLLRFDLSAPGAATLVGSFSIGGSSTVDVGGNVVPVSLDAIDYRAATGVLYGYWDLTDTVYSVNTGTGALTAVATGTGAGATNTNLLGMDFNPTTGGGTGSLFRVVTESAQNLVYNVAAPAQPAVATGLFYPLGDAATTANPAGGVNVVENAYTNNLAGALTTQQYGIDYVTDSLVTIGNNAGTLGTVNNTLGNLGLDVSAYVGFDIFTTLGGVNTAYALLDTSAAGTAPGLFTINLATGAATPIGTLGGGFGQVYGLAVTPAATNIPEPGTVALIGAGLLPLAGTALRRRRA